MWRIAGLVFGAVTFAITHTVCVAAGPAAVPSGVAVVELFTSQGCSSCPPADDELGRLNAAAANDHTPVFTLAFHVDYWDHGGWRDRFSDATFTARQYAYGRLLHLDQVYTPQMIVNGRTQFDGSDVAKADRAIADALATAAAVPISVSEVTRASDGGWQVKYAAPAATAELVVNLAVVEQGLATKVLAGENAGRQMDQPSVVRWFAVAAATAGGEVATPALPQVKAQRSTVVAFVQRPGDGAVLGAAAVPLP